MTPARAVRADYFPAALQGNAANDPSGNFADPLHLISSSLPPSHAKHAMETTVTTKDLNGRTFQKLPIDMITPSDLAKTVAGALVVDFGDYTAKHKRIAKAAGAASEKSAENWTQGHNPPSFLHGLRLMAKSPTLRKEIMRLCDLEAGLDPDFQRDLIALIQRMQAAGVSQ